MFGYVQISKTELDEETFKNFRAYYCGLCKAIGKNSQIARMGLSYDMTFLSVLLSAVEAEEPQIKECRCMLHPFKKEQVICNSKVLDYVADMSVLLCFKKFEDDWNDDKTLSSLFFRGLYFKAAKKIGKRYKKKSDVISENLALLSNLEKQNCTFSDEVADCFAKICEELFVPDFIEDENTKKTLSWFGYNIGRWVYLIDAIDDVEKDVKNKSYNPFAKKFLEKGREKLANELESGLTYTLANITASYDILEIKRNGKILENIIYSGLAGVQERILLKKQEEKDGSLQGSGRKSWR